MATVYSKVVSNTNNDLTNERVAAGTVDIGSLGSRAADDVIYTGCKVPEGAIVTEVTWFVRPYVQEDLLLLVHGYQDLTEIVV